MAEPKGSLNLKGLRRRCEKRLSGLPVPVPFDLDEFSRELAVRNGRPIVLQPVDQLGAETMGAWIPTPAADIIVYASQTPRVHREHIVLHELSHIICGHRPEASDPETAALLFPDLQEDAVRAFLNRRSYSSEQELEAELLATLILEKSARRTGGSGLEAGIDPELVGRLEAFRQGDAPA